VGPALFIFVTVTVGIIAGYQLLAGLIAPDAERVRKRLAREFDPAQNTPTASPLFRESQLDMRLDADANGAPPPRQSAWRQLERMLKQARVPLSLQQLGLLACIIGLLAGIAGVWLGGVVLGLPLAVAGALSPLAYVHLRVKARREKLLRQLPGAFELMARVLRAGSSTPQALQAIGDSFEDPIAGEFAQCQKQLDLGLRPEVIYQEMAERSGIVELRIFVMAMMIQRQTGGNLSDVLDRLAGLIRTRLRLRQHVRTLTAEGRMQGLVLTGLPFFVFGALLIVNAEYAMVLFDHVPLLLATAGAMVLGTLWIRRIVNFAI
jgi:tight adherence protein B